MGNAESDASGRYWDRFATAPTHIVVFKTRRRDHQNKVISENAHYANVRFSDDIGDFVLSHDAPFGGGGEMLPAGTPLQDLKIAAKDGGASIKSIRMEKL